MQVVQESVSPTQLRFSLTEEVSVVQKRVDAELAKNQRNIKMNGFRPGKVPMSLVKERFGKAIEKEVSNQFLQESLEQLFTDRKLDLVAPPKLLSFTQKDAQHLEIIVDVEVYPPMRIDVLDSLRIQRPVVEIKDTDVAETILAMQRITATWTPVDRPIAMGDRISFKFQECSSDAEELDWRKAQQEQIILTENMPSLDGLNQFLGMVVGESRLITLTYHEFGIDLSSVENIPVSVLVQVNKIEESVLPELTDEFTQKVSSDPDMDLLRFQVEIKEEMMQHSENCISTLLKKSVFMEIAKANGELPVPESLLSLKRSAVNNLMVNNTSMQRIKWQFMDPVLRSDKVEVEAQKASLVAMALRLVASSFNLSVTNEELQQSVYQLASRYEASESVAAQMMQNKDMRMKLEEDILSYKALARVTGLLQIVDAEPMGYQKLNAVYASLMIA